MPSSWTYAPLSRDRLKDIAKSPIFWGGVIVLLIFTSIIAEESSRSKTPESSSKQLSTVAANNVTTPRNSSFILNSIVEHVLSSNTKAERIYELSKKAGLRQVTLNESICMTKECLTFSEELLLNLKGTANPCENFYEYACGGTGDILKIDWTSLMRVKDMVALHFNLSKEISAFSAKIQSSPNSEDPRYIIEARDHFNQCLTGGGEDYFKLGNRFKAIRHDYCMQLSQARFGSGRLVKNIEAGLISQQTKREAEEIANNILEVFKRFVSSLEMDGSWLEKDEETKRKVEEQLNTFKIAIGYSDVLEDDDIKKLVLFGEGGQSSINFWNDSSFKTLEFSSTYIAKNNTFVIPVRNIPKMEDTLPKYLSYAGLSEVILVALINSNVDIQELIQNESSLIDEVHRHHEIEKFYCILDEYKSIYSNWGLVEGKNLTLLQAVVDSYALPLSLKAYELHVKKHGEELPLPGLESLTVDQLFFLGFATGLCEDAKLAGKGAPAEFRVNNAVKKLQAFYHAFNCPMTEAGPMKGDSCVSWD